MTKLKEKVAVLMATYNGEKFIREQIDSLLNQSYQDFIIYITDDNSTDNTFKILQQYREEYPKKIFIKQNETNSGNGKHVFFDLLSTIDADYYYFCDQDDVWLENKIEVLLHRIKSIEKDYFDNPILVFSDTRVVDEKLKTIHPSMVKYMHLKYSNLSLNNALSQNVVSGCSLVFNKKIKDFFQTKPKYFIMHDWWVYLIAISFGIVDFYNDATILYRQHQSNLVGASKSWNIFNTKNFTSIANTYNQAECFLDIYESRLSNDAREIFKKFLTIQNKRKISRIYILIKFNFLKKPLYKSLGHILYI